MADSSGQLHSPLLVHSDLLTTEIIHETDPSSFDKQQLRQQLSPHHHALSLSPVVSRGGASEGASEGGRGLELLFKAEYLANFGVQYNFTNLPIALMFLWSGGRFDDDKWGGSIDSVLKSAVFVGAILGMVSMGYVGDVVGRNNGFAITSLIMVIFSVASAFAPYGPGFSATMGHDNAMVLLAVTRFGLGFGIGGCYPLSAAKSSEGSSSARLRNLQVGLNLVYQGLGNIAPYAVAMALVPLGDSNSAALWAFRIMLGVGALPPLVVLFCTWGQEESRAFSQRRGRESEGFLDHLRVGFAEDPDMWKHLVATALAWGLYDIAYYGVNQFTPEMTTAIFGDGGDDDDENNADDDGASGSVQSNAQIDSISMAVGIPAVLHALWCLDRLGTKRLQVYGFVVIAASCCGIAIAWDPLSSDTPADKGLLFTLSLVLCAAVNWGPNMTTFVLPQEVFATKILATFNGIAAASGKFGAVCGIWIFESVYHALGMIPLMLVVALLNLIGAWLSHTCISDELWERQQMRRRQAEETASNPFSTPTHSSSSRPSDYAGSSSTSVSQRPTEASSHTSVASTISRVSSAM